MKTLADYAVRNGVRDVILLHCPEKKYSDAFVATIQKKADAVFTEINKDLKKPLRFKLDIRKGLLQKNLADLLEEEDVLTVFVGLKMLDYRLSQIKKLKTAFYFLQ